MFLHAYKINKIMLIFFFWKVFFLRTRDNFNPPKRSEGQSLAIRPDTTCPAVTCSFSHTIEARGLKFGMHIPDMDGFKVTNQIFDILFGYYVMGQTCIGETWLCMCAYIVYTNLNLNI